MIALKNPDLVLPAIQQIETIIELIEVSEQNVHLSRVTDTGLGTDIVYFRFSYPVSFSARDPADADPNKLPVIHVDHRLLRPRLQRLRQ